MEKSLSDIKIDDNVVDYMTKKGKHTLTLDINKSGGGCCPTIEVVEISFKEPENLNAYKCYIEKGINVYVSKQARVTSPVLKFILSKTLFSKQIIPIGLTLKSH